MYLKTLGGLKLEGSDLARHKPLLLLAYLALEGRQPRRDVAALFWLGYKNPLSNLSVALSHLRKVDESLVKADDTYVEARVKCDALELLASEADAEILQVYRGAFLEGVFLNDWSAELEEWVYEQRESLSAFARARLLGLAEVLAAQEQLAKAARRAEEAYRLRGAPPLAPEDLSRFHRLFTAAQHPYAQKVRAEAEELGLDLDSPQEVTPPSLQPPSLISTTLPRPTTPLIGRERELAELLALLENARIVTVTGLSGCGKTRLALELTHTLKQGKTFEGVYFVPLQGVTDFQEARRRGAQALGIPPVEVELSPDRIREVVGDKEVLFFLDDVDATVQAAPALTEFLWACPKAKLLVTSQERLKLTGEQLYPLQGLSFATQEEEVGPVKHDAATLFAARAARVKPGFALNASTLPDILRICELVEGLPLAVELAAPWVKLLPLKTIADEIATNLDFLRQDSRSPLPAYPSMRAAFEQTWQRLDEGEQGTLKALSLFQASFGLDAARVVAGVSLSDLLNLHDKSLLEVLPGGRFYLVNLLRRFLREKLGDAGRDDLERAFVTHYAGVLADAEEKITDQIHMSNLIETLEQDLPNVEQAWRWALDKEMSAFFRAANVATAAFFDFTGRWQTGIQLFEEAVTWAESKNDAELWGALVRGLWRLLYSSGSEMSLEYAQKALAQAKKRGLTSLEAYLTLGIARIHTVLGDIGSARKVLERCPTLDENADNDADFPIMIEVSLAELELLHGNAPAPKLFDPATLETLEGDSFMLSVLFYESRYALRHGDLEHAEAHMKACMALAEKLNYLSFSPYYHDTLALILHARGDYTAAEATAREGYRFAEQEAAVGMMLGLEATLARILPYTGQLSEAQTFLQKGLRSAWSRRVKPVVLKGVVGFAEQCIVTERFAEAAQALRLALNHPATMRIEHPLIEKRLDELGDIAADLEDVTLKDWVERMLEG